MPLRRLTVLALLAASAAAQAAPVPGKDYLPVAPAITDGVPGRLEVLVFFRYGCLTCETVAPAIAAFAAQRPADVDVIHVPVIVNAGDEGPARMFYSLAQLGLEEKLRSSVYRAVLDPKQRLNLNDRAAVQDWVARQPGVDAAAFTKAYSSFGVEMQRQRARKRAVLYPGGNLPGVFVGGRYRVEPGSWVPLLRDKRPTYPGFVALMNELVGMARKAAAEAPAR